MANQGHYTYSEAFGDEQYERDDILLKTGDFIAFVNDEGHVIGTVTHIAYRDSVVSSFELIDIEGNKDRYRTGLINSREGIVVFYGTKTWER